MPLYELGVIVDPEVPPEDETSTLERLEGIITEAGGEVVGKDTWGRRARLPDQEEELRCLPLLEGRGRGRGPR